jgi:hypothetical protein
MGWNRQPLKKDVQPGQRTLSIKYIQPIENHLECKLPASFLPAIPRRRNLGWTHKRMKPEKLIF